MKDFKMKKNFKLIIIAVVFIIVIVIVIIVAVVMSASVGTKAAKNPYSKDEQSKITAGSFGFT